jgi:hypothetical protein
MAIGLPSPCFALDLEPRTWSHIPLGGSFAGGALVHTDADIFVNPALLLEDVEMRLDTMAAKYPHSFEFFGKSARIDVTQGYQEGRWRGLVDGTSTTVTRSGWSDTFVRIAANLYGAPPLAGKEFADYRARTKDETSSASAWPCDYRRGITWTTSSSTWVRTDTPCARRSGWFSGAASGPPKSPPKSPSIPITTISLMAKPSNRNP